MKIWRLIIFGEIFLCITNQISNQAIKHAQTSTQILLNWDKYKIIIRWRAKNPNGTLYPIWQCNRTKIQRRVNFLHEVKKLYSLFLITWVLKCPSFMVHYVTFQTAKIGLFTPWHHKVIKSVLHWVSSPDPRCPPQLWEHKTAFGCQSTPSNADSVQRSLFYDSESNETERNVK